MLPTVSLAAVLSLAAAGLAGTSEVHERNLVYRSPIIEWSELGHDVSHITKRDAAGADYAGPLDFKFGVASGDPDHQSAIVWTHPVPAAPGQSVCLRYEVSKKQDKFDKKHLVDSAEVRSTPDVDYAFKAEAKNLKPSTQYFYRWVGCKNDTIVSPVGAFKTTPAPSDKNVKPISFGVYTCSNFPEGFFSAYRSGVEQNVDFWLHLGDYIYESFPKNPPAPTRIVAPKREISTLDDYRQRYATYHTDAGLLLLRQQKALFAVPDDHEVADQSWKAGTADSNNTVAGEVNGVQFNARKANAFKAYNEWIPMRPHPSDKDYRVWRKFEMGDLLSLQLWDTRQYDRDITDLYYNTAEIYKIKDDEQRSLMGMDQEAWAMANLAHRNAKWGIVAQQIVMNQLFEQSGSPDVLKAMDYDAWDGYTANRRRIIETIKRNKIDNVVVLAGDSHAAWAYDGSLPSDLNSYDAGTGKGSRFVEFGTTAVSSSSSYGRNLTQAKYDAHAQDLVLHNKNLQFADGARRGWFKLTVAQKKVTADFFGVENIFDPNSAVTKLVSLEVKDGANRITRPINGGQKPASGVLQADVVNYRQQKWNGTTFV